MPKKCSTIDFNRNIRKWVENILWHTHLQQSRWNILDIWQHETHTTCRNTNQFNILIDFGQISSIVEAFICEQLQKYVKNAYFAKSSLDLWTMKPLNSWQVPVSRLKVVFWVPLTFFLVEEHRDHVNFVFKRLCIPHWILSVLSSLNWIKYFSLKTEIRNFQPILLYVYLSLCIRKKKIV